MRICVIAHYTAPHIGGVEQVSLEQAQRMAQRGHSVVLVSSNPDARGYSEVRDTVRIQRICASNVMERWLGVPYPLFAPTLLRVLQEEISHSDVCLIHSFGFLSSFLAAWIAVCNRVPYVIYQYNTFVHYPNLALRLIERANDLIAGRFVLDHAAAILAVSESTRRYCQTLTRHPVSVLYEAVNLLDYCPGQIKQEARRKLGLPEDVFIVLTTGRLVFKRGVGTFVAVADLLREDPRFLFVVVGDGPERSTLAQYVETRRLHNCRIVGSVPHQSVPTYYHAADIFVLSSRTGEGLPISLLEAWAAKLPVIATSAGGQVEVIREGQNGFLVPPDSAGAIARLLQTQIHNTDSLQQIGGRGRATADQLFTWCLHMETLLLTLQRCANNTRK